jgi:minor histocompatibility antigen H13
MFPVMGSMVLFGLYLLFRFFNKEYINYLLTAYFSILGIGALTKAFDGVAKSVPGVKSALWNEKFKLRLWKRPKKGVFSLIF